MSTNLPQEKPSIGFIGLGHMGILMVQRLLQAGYQLTVYDRTAEKAQEFVHQGTKSVDSPREFAAVIQFMEQLSGIPTGKKL